MKACEILFKILVKGYFATVIDTIMANLISSAKLDFYNIHLEREESLEFFGIPVLPDPAQSIRSSSSISKPTTCSMIATPNSSTCWKGGVHSNGFVFHMRRMETREDGRLHRRPLTNDILLLVQDLEDSQPFDASAMLTFHSSGGRPELCLLGLFSVNAAKASATSRPIPLNVFGEAHSFPRSCQDGTAFTFLKIPVAQELVAHVWHGTQTLDIELLRRFMTVVGI